MKNKNVPPHVIKALHRALRIIQDAHDKGAGRDNWLGREENSFFDPSDRAALETIVSGLLHFDGVGAEVARALKEQDERGRMGDALRSYNHGNEGPPAVAVAGFAACVCAGVSFQTHAYYMGVPFAVFTEMPVDVPAGVLIVCA
jgi:hypothetical protein